MQKVEGSSPFIRFRKAPRRRGFLFQYRRQSIEMPADLPAALARRATRGGSNASALRSAPRWLARSGAAPARGSRAGGVRHECGVSLIRTRDAPASPAHAVRKAVAVALCRDNGHGLGDPWVDLEQVSRIHAGVRTMMILSVRLRRPDSGKQVAFGGLLRLAILKAEVCRHCGRHQTSKDNGDDDDRQGLTIARRETSHTCS
jgi:hypothetical protein